MDVQLTQTNVAKMRAPTDDPIMAEFMANLAPIIALADAAPGFVWRLQTDDGNATSLQVFDATLIIVNMSVRTSVEALKGYVYKSRHVDFMRRRKAWFEKYVGMHFALWWVPSEHVPDTVEAKGRLEHRNLYGDTKRAFSFQNVFGLALTESQV